MTKTPQTDSFDGALLLRGSRVERVLGIGKTTRHDLQKRGLLETVRLGARATRYTVELVRRLAHDGIPASTPRSPIPPRNFKRGT